MSGSLEDLVRKRTAWAVLLPAAFLCMVVLVASTIHMYRQTMRIVTLVGDAQSKAVEQFLDLQRDNWTFRLMGFHDEPDSTGSCALLVKRFPEFCMVSLFDSSGSLLNSWPRRDVLRPPRLDGTAWTGVESNPRCEGPVIRMETRLEGGVVGVATLLLDGLSKQIEPYVQEANGLQMSLVDLYGRPILRWQGVDRDRTDHQGWLAGNTGRRSGFYLKNSQWIAWSATPVHGTPWQLMARIDVVDIAKQMLPALAALGLFLLGVFLVAGRMARFVVTTFREPVADLVTRAKELEEERWEERLPTSGLKELEDLTNAFTQMAQRVAERERVRRSALEERTEQLERALREMETFSYSVSHDLRAPLRAVDGFSRVLEEDAVGRLLPEDKDALGRIRRATSRMSEIIDDLLALSKANRTALSVMKVDMGAMVREIVDGLQEPGMHRGVACDFGDLGFAMGDRGLIRQVWTNILSNAFKFSSRRSDAMVVIRSERSDGQSAWTVSDNGVGFDRAAAKKLFQPFRRMHSDADFPGTGIGLAIVQRIVERHGGKVVVDSRPGEGTTVRFSLPESPVPDES